METDSLYVNSKSAQFSQNRQNTMNGHSNRRDQARSTLRQPH